MRSPPHPPPPPCKLAWVSLPHGRWLPLEWVTHESKEKRKGDPNTESTCFHNPLLEMMYLQLCYIQSVTNTDSGPCGQVWHGVWAQEAGWLQAILEAASLRQQGSRPLSLLCLEGKITRVTATGNQGIGQWGWREAFPKKQPWGVNRVNVCPRNI